MVVDIKVWGHVTNPVEYEDNWVRSFAEANGGLAPLPEDKGDAASKRRSFMRTRADEPTVYDNEWHLAVDTIAGLYINYLYSPNQKLNFDCLGADTLIYEGQTEYNKGKVYGTKSLSQINSEVDAILLTGGIAYSELLTGWIREYVSFLAPVEVLPGENEMQALALGGLRLLRQEESPNIYHLPEGYVL